jgi:putative transcriptional regulator
MNNATKRTNAFERIKAGLEECLAFTRGELTLRTTVIPSRPPSMSVKAIIRLRRSMKMSQSVFARMLNVSTKTVQSWEQGERKPSQAALRLLQVLRARPKVVGEVVGIPLAAGSR